MRPRPLLSCVDRLPTIREIHDEGDPDGPASALDEYVDSIRELSQPPRPCYPLHGPLRGHRRRRAAGAAPLCPLLPRPPRTHPAPLDVSDVSLIVTERTSRHRDVRETLEGQSVFAGL